MSHIECFVNHFIASTTPGPVGPVIGTQAPTATHSKGNLSFPVI